MRYFPMMLAAGLMSAGLLSGSGPAHAVPALALDRSAVADTRSKRLPTTIDTPGDIIAATITVMAITMATTGPILGYHRPYYGGYGYGRRWRY